MKEYDKNGNEIIRGFSMAGCDGSELRIIEKLFNKGYKELYYSAPYFWGVINLEENKIFTYTEGDTSLTICKDKKSLIKELKGYIKFLKDSGQANPVEAEELLKEVLVCKK